MFGGAQQYDVTLYVYTAMMSTFGSVRWSTVGVAGIAKTVRRGCREDAIMIMGHTQRQSARGENAAGTGTGTGFRFRPGALGGNLEAASPGGEGGGRGWLWLGVGRERYARVIETLSATAIADGPRPAPVNSRAPT